METLESSRVCRLCGKHSGISINIFDRNESHVKKINAVLPIMVHEMDLLPKHMCHRCSYKLEEFHKFYVDCLKTDANLKSQLSWMSKTESRKSTGTPMVHIENLHVKTEPRDYYDLYDDDSTIEMDSLTYPVNGVRKNIPEDIKYATYTRCDYCCDNDDQSNQTVSTNYEKKVKKCDRISERNNAGCDGNVEKFQDVKKRPTVDACSSKTRSRLKRKIEGQGNEGRVNFLGTSESSSNSMLHNLRPRTGSINYKDTRKRVVPDAEISAKITKKISAPRPAFGESLQRFSETQIKVEKEDELEGRILRLRKRTNYLEKSSQVVKNDQRTRSSKKLVSDSKLSASQTPSAHATTLRIKQEVLSDLEDKATEELQRTKRVLRSQAVRNFDAKVNTVSNKILLELKKNVINHRKPGRPRKHRINCGLADNSSSLENVEKNLMKLNSASLKRIAEIGYSSKYSNRNGDFKNNRARKLNVEKKGGLKDNLKNYGEKNLLEVIQGMVNSESPAERMNLIENKIKHYCDECDTQFASKELYKLHPCYV